MNPAELNLNPMTQIDLGLIVAVILIVIATYIALRRVYVLPYLRVLEERERLFESAEVQGVEATVTLEESKADAEQAVAQAAAQAEEMRAQAQGRADAYRRQRTADATSAAAARLEAGRAEIALARAAEVTKLRSEAIECVSIACRQLLGGVDDEAVATTVDRLMQRQAE